jgi:hypothetical protein
MLTLPQREKEAVPTGPRKTVGLLLLHGSLNHEDATFGKAKMLRNNPGPNEGAFVTQFNDMMSEPPKGH